jgi:hypothetical protein
VMRSWSRRRKMLHNVVFIDVFFIADSEDM